MVLVADTFPGYKLSIGISDGNNRSYRVSFDKIHVHLLATHQLDQNFFSVN